MKRIYLVILACLFIFGCSGVPAPVPPTPTPPVTVDPEKLGPDISKALMQGYLDATADGTMVLGESLLITFDTIEVILKDTGNWNKAVGNGGQTGGSIFLFAKTATQAVLLAINFQDPTTHLLTNAWNMLLFDVATTPGADIANAVINKISERLLAAYQDGKVTWCELTFAATDAGAAGIEAAGKWNLPVGGTTLNIVYTEAVDDIEVILNGFGVCDKTAFFVK